MDRQDLISALLLAAGALVAGGGLVRLLRSETWRARDTSPSPPDEPGPEAANRGAPRRVRRAAVGLALLTVVVGLEGIERRGMSHVEVYIPNIELPDGLSEPPPRLDLGDVVWWHWHDEPHPPGYFVAMWGWTKAFGTSLVSLRLPGVLFGGLAVGLMVLVGARLYGAAAGLVAAGLLALNGHHVYWMQNARMYEPSLAFGLLSTWLWIRLLERDRLPLWEAVAYVAATAAGVYLQVYVWPFIAGQMAWTLLVASRRRVHPVLGLQTLAVILGTPMWAHAVYRAYSQPQNATSFTFVQDFLNFGFLFQPDDWSLVARDVAAPVEWLVTALAVGAQALVVARPRSDPWRPAVARR
ncbi:MAG: glycosyltransferase family 39 protein, partial [Longimicrobiales bacterium]